MLAAAAAIPNTTPTPVRYMWTGSVILSETDLDGGGYLIPWGHTRSYGNQLNGNIADWNGNSWLVPQVEKMVINGGTATVVRDVQTSLCVLRSPAVPGPRNTDPKTLLSAATPDPGDTYETFSQSSGVTKVFYGNAPTLPYAQRGSLKAIILPGGAQANLSYDAITGDLLTYLCTDGVRSQRATTVCLHDGGLLARSFPNFRRHLLPPRPLHLLRRHHVLRQFRRPSKRDRSGLYRRRLDDALERLLPLLQTGRPPRLHLGPQVRGGGRRMGPSRRRRLRPAFGRRQRDRRIRRPIISSTTVPDA